MTYVRRPAASGSFYPEDPERLATVVDELLASAEVPQDVPAGIEPEAIVVPHAGYVYSGPVAATAYALLRAAGVLGPFALLGPAHYIPIHGPVVPNASAWKTPLGEVAIDSELREVAVGAGAATSDAPHEPEHSLEVQLPFLQRAFGNGVRVLPVAVGMSAPADIAALIAALRGAGAFVLVSSDLSHYNDDETARLLDRRTADAVLACDPGKIGPEDACGAYALRGIVEHARHSDLDARLLDLRTSADTAGDPSRVVGYGAFAMFRRS